MSKDIIQKTLTLNDIDFYIKHLSIVNVFLPVNLTPKEIEILAGFMSLTGDIAKERFGTSARKLIMKKLNLSPGGMGNYLRVLKEKGFITEDYEILPILHPKANNQMYVFKLIKK